MFHYQSAHHLPQCSVSLSNPFYYSWLKSENISVQDIGSNTNIMYKNTLIHFVFHYQSAQHLPQCFACLSNPFYYSWLKSENISVQDISSNTNIMSLKTQFSHIPRIIKVCIRNKAINTHTHTHTHTQSTQMH
jgi:hypothetical protein